MVKPDLEIPATNKTNLGLYVLPDEAYRMCKDDPDGVKILDVRTFEEYIFVGHPEMARNIPFVFPKFDPEGPSMPGKPPGFSVELNPEFITKAKEAFKPTDKILVMCATGGRGAKAVNVLAKAGFKNVYNIVNGFVGDRVNDPGSAYHGKHMRNGWKNLGLPWGYAHHPDLMWTSEHR